MFRHIAARSGLAIDERRRYRAINGVRLLSRIFSLPDINIMSVNSILIRMMGTEEQRAGFAQCLAFDVEEARRDIVEFVRAEVKNFGADGALVGLSGGLDSSTVACLCVEALGRDRVMGLVLPERDTSPVNTGDAVDLAKRLGIQYQKIDISPILRDIGRTGSYPTRRRRTGRPWSGRWNASSV